MKKAIVFILIMMTGTESAVGQGTYVTGYVKEAETGLGLYDALVFVMGALAVRFSGWLGPYR